MGKIGISLVGLSTAILLSGLAWAGTVDLGNHSKSEISATCAKVGGNFRDIGEGGEYSCTKGDNVVDCTSNGHCVGVCSNCTSGAPGHHLAGVEGFLHGVQNEVPAAKLKGADVNRVPSEPNMTKEKMQ